MSKTQTIRVNPATFTTPHIEDALIVFLEAIYRTEAIHPKSEINAIMYAAGQQSVIAYLRRLKEIQDSAAAGRELKTTAAAPERNMR